MATLTASYQLLAESAYYTFLSAYGGKVCLRLYAKVSAQNVSGNTSTVDIKLTKYLTGSSTQVAYSCYQKEAGLSGDLSHTWSNGDYATFYALSEYTIFEKAFTVTHNADGTKSLSLAASYDDSYVAALSINTVVCTLPTIVRKSEIGGVAVAEEGIEHGFVVFFDAASSAFGHQLDLLAGSQVIARRPGYSSGQPFILSNSEQLALYRAVGRTGTVTIRLHTFTSPSQSTWLSQSDTAVHVSLGNVYVRVGGTWRRGLMCVGGAPAVVMVNKNGTWRPAL